MVTRGGHPSAAPPEGGAARLTVAHFKNGGPVYNDALSRLHDIPGPLLLMLPTDLAAALRRELDSCEGLRVGGEAGADSSLLALLHRGAADECRWGALVPQLARRDTYMANPPRGHHRPELDDLIAAFHNHGIFCDDTWQEVRQKTLGRDDGRRVRARLLELRDPLRQRWDDLWLRRLDPWSPPSHLPHTCHLCGDRHTVSSAPATGTNRCTQCSQVVAYPWPEPLAGPHRRTEEEALHRRIGVHTLPHTAAPAPRVPPSCGSTCTCGTPRPSRTSRTCSRPDPRPPPRFAEPAAPCLADGGTGWSTPVPAAERRRRPSGA